MNTFQYNCWFFPAATPNLNFTLNVNAPKTTAASTGGFNFGTATKTTAASGGFNFGGSLGTTGNSHIQTKVKDVKTNIFD